MSLSEHFTAWLYVSSQTVFIDLVFDLLLFNVFDKVIIDSITASVTIPLMFWDYKQLMSIGWLRSIFLCALTMTLAFAMMLCVGAAIIIAVFISGVLPV